MLQTVALSGLRSGSTARRSRGGSRGRKWNACLCLDGDLLVADPLLLVDLAQGVHEGFAGQLQALDAHHIVLELLLQLGRRIL